MSKISLTKQLLKDEAYLCTAIRITAATLAMAFLTSTAMSQDGSNEAEREANKTLVETLSQLRGEPVGHTAGRLRALDHALSKFDDIVQDYPSSAIAVQLATGQPIGTMNPIKLRAERDAILADLCTREPEEAQRLSERCLLFVDEMLQAMARTREDAQAKIADIQTKLHRAEADLVAKDAEIASLTSRLNQALVRRVDELSRSRSAFFGRLRDVLGERQDVRVVGDRFVFQSEVLFPVGSAELQPGGEEQLATFAATLKRIATQFPPGVDWLLRIDGHTDRQPITGGPFPTNWQLSTARALSVLNYLSSQGIPPQRMAAAGFGEWQPLDPGTTPDAYRRNRRIEIRLDQRIDGLAGARPPG